MPSLSCCCVRASFALAGCRPLSCCLISRPRRARRPQHPVRRGGVRGGAPAGLPGAGAGAPEGEPQHALSALAAWERDRDTSVSPLLRACTHCCTATLLAPPPPRRQIQNGVHSSEPAPPLLAGERQFLPRCQWLEDGRSRQISTDQHNADVSEPAAGAGDGSADQRCGHRRARAALHPGCAPSAAGRRVEGGRRPVCCASRHTAGTRAAITAPKESTDDLVNSESSFGSTFLRDLLDLAGDEELNDIYYGPLDVSDSLWGGRSAPAHHSLPEERRLAQHDVSRCTGHHPAAVRGGPQRHAPAGSAGGPA